MSDFLLAALAVGFFADAWYTRKWLRQNKALLEEWRGARAALTRDDLP
jgi:hypothetical protein